VLATLVRTLPNEEFQPSLEPKTAKTPPLVALQRYRTEWQQAHWPQRGISQFLLLKAYHPATAAHTLVEQVAAELKLAHVSAYPLGPQTLLEVQREHAALASQAQTPGSGASHWSGAPNSAAASNPLEPWSGHGELCKRSLDLATTLWVFNHIVVAPYSVAQKLAYRATLKKDYRLQTALELGEGVQLLRVEVLAKAFRGGSYELAEHLRRDFNEGHVPLRPLSRGRPQHAASLVPTRTLCKALALVDMQGPLQRSVGGAPMLAPLGLPAWENPFSGHSGANTLITGDAGSGRTYLANEMLVSHVADGGIAWTVRQKAHPVLDDFIGAKEVALNKAAPLSLNPFSLVKADHYWDSARWPITQWVLSLANVGHPADDYVATRSYQLSKALDQAWADHKQELTVTRLLPYLEDVGGTHLAEALRSKLAEMARWFEGSCELSLDQNLSFDLSPLAGEKDQPLVASALLTAFSVLLYQGHFLARKLFVLDELALLRDPPTRSAGLSMNALLQTCMRMQRAYNSGLLVVSEPVRNGGRQGTHEEAVWENSAHKLLLISPRNEDSLDRNFRSPKLEHQLRQLKTEPGRYAVHLHLGDFNAPYALASVPDPATRALLGPLTDDQVGTYLLLRDAGHSAMSALAEVLDDADREKARI
jgi:hypothetical protein